jgi:hypothetical protein
MNEEIMKADGFGDLIEEVKAGRCPFCHREIKLDEFRDNLSRREFQISGLCQKCQNEFFGAKPRCRVL